VSLNVDADFVANKEQWAGIGLDPVDLQYILPVSSRDFRSNPTASPLPPVANRIFGAEVAYPPYIPLMSDSLREQMKLQQEIMRQMMDNWRPIGRDDILNDENFGRTSTTTSGGAGGFGGGAMGGTSGGTGNISGMLTPGGGGAGGMGGFGGTSGGGMRGMGSPGGMGGDFSGMGGLGGMSDGRGGGGLNNPWRFYTKTSPTVMVEARYRLFRYFDFTVEPDKSYQYRVRLAVYNPNFRLIDLYLEEEAIVTKRTPVIWSEFSYPSGLVAVNSNARVLAKSVGNIPPANRAWQPQTVTISSIVFDESDHEDYIVKERTGVTQGTVLNFRQPGQRVSEIVSPAGMTSMDITPRSSGRNQPTARTTTKTLDHISNVCVLDVAGRRRLIGSNHEHTPPGQVLFMASDGTMEIQSIKSNRLELDRYERPETTTMGGAMGRM
jgi:hypothetical protein